MSDYLLILRVVITLAIAAFGLGSIWLMCERAWRKNDRWRRDERHKVLPPEWQDD